MASSNNLAAIEPWMFKSTIADSWYPESFAKETESALTKALQQSFFNTQQLSQINQHNHHPISVVSPSFSLKQSDYQYHSTTPSASTVTASGSGSERTEPETPGSKRRGFNTNLGVSVAKPVKRKSRASKQSMTTFIQADPANFRQMVQQVTGVKFEGTGQLPVFNVVKPEPMRQSFVNKLQGLLPTLDTSAYLLQHQDNSVRRVPVTGSTTTGMGQLPAMNQLTEDGVDFYSFSSFPTLESSF